LPKKNQEEKKMKSRYVLSPVVLLLALFIATAIKGQDDGPPTGPFWVYARIEVNTTKHAASGDKNEFRVYVSNLLSVTPDEWDRLQMSYKAAKNVSEYFDATVGKAAESVGEEFSYYDQDVEWDCTCVGTANEARPKSDVEEKRNEVIATAKENGHPVLFFNWDPTSKNKDQDLQSEMKKRGAPSAKPAPAAKPPDQ
jgi:hypothetical protein